MARMAQFLPENVRTKLDSVYQKAVKSVGKASEATDENYSSATAELKKIDAILDKNAPQLRVAECNHLREQIRTTLDRDGNVLEKSDLEKCHDVFAKLDIETPAEESAAQQHLEDLQDYVAELTTAIEDRFSALSDLIVDYERLTPILQRALKIEHDKHAELDKAVHDVNAGLLGDM